MADSRMLAVAAEKANLRLSPTEEQRVWHHLRLLDEQIKEAIAEKKDVKEPYEIN